MYGTIINSFYYHRMIYYDFTFLVYISMYDFVTFLDPFDVFTNLVLFLDSFDNFVPF